MLTWGKIMATQPVYQISYEDDDVVVRFLNGVLDREQVSRFLDYLVLESIRQKSEMTEEQALADEIDQRAWSVLNQNNPFPSRTDDALDD